jgi:signal transduction histidine kinase
MIPRIRRYLLFALPGVLLAVTATVLLLEAPTGDHLRNAVRGGITTALVWLVAASVQNRYPDRPLGRMLFLLAGASTFRLLLGSPDPYLFTLAHSLQPAVETILIWIILAFPSGRLLQRSERIVMAASVLALAALWLPFVMLTPTFPNLSPIDICQPTCPRNVLQVADQPALAAGLYLAFRVAAGTILIATASILLARLLRATPLMRRAIAPVLFAAIFRALSVAVFLLTNRPPSLQGLPFLMIPIAIAFGLFWGRIYMAKVLQQLVAGLRTRPEMDALRAVMANALSDESLSIVYWQADTGCWIDANGQRVELPGFAPDQGRAVTVVRDAADRRVAALIHDAAILETPTLIEAVTGSMLTALESHRIEAELKTSRASALSAVDDERQRIERDLHDGAQQRLIAMRMKLSVTERLFDKDRDRAKALIGELGKDVEAAIAELRIYAHGIIPPLLAERGLAAALADAGQRAGLPTSMDVESVGRCDPGIERAIYFCCLEALQNAAKHAGTGAPTRLTLRREVDNLCFTVCDDGVGLSPGGKFSDGQGLRNMRERIEAVGGELEIVAGANGGTNVTGRVPFFPGHS